LFPASLINHPFFRARLRLINYSQTTVTAFTELRDGLQVRSFHHQERSGAKIEQEFWAQTLVETQFPPPTPGILELPASFYLGK